MVRTTAFHAVNEGSIPSYSFFIAGKVLMDTCEFSKLEY